jgi:hypothetical protein
MFAGLITDNQAKSLRGLAERLKERGLLEESGLLTSFLTEVSLASEKMGTAGVAAMLSVTQQTVRNWVRAGILPGAQDANGHFSVSLEALVPAMRQLNAVPDAPPTPLSDEEIDAEITAVRAARRFARSRAG